MPALDSITHAVPLMEMAAPAAIPCNTERLLRPLVREQIFLKMVHSCRFSAMQGDKKSRRKNEKNVNDLFLGLLVALLQAKENKYTS